MSGFDPGRLARLGKVLADHVDRDDVAGVAWLAARDDDVEVGWAGRSSRGGAPLARDSIFRIASTTKPIVAVAALILVEECRLRLDDPVEDLLPELAGRRVLVDPRGPVDGDTVTAHRPITVGDVLTFRLGLGMDFAVGWPQPAPRSDERTRPGRWRARAAGATRAGRVDAPVGHAPAAVPAR
jgi:CubicO group peptidase (beta-lactamase class C family)